MPGPLHPQVAPTPSATPAIVAAAQRQAGRRSSALPASLQCLPFKQSASKPALLATGPAPPSQLLTWCMKEEKSAFSALTRPTKRRGDTKPHFFFCALT